MKKYTVTVDGQVVGTRTSYRAGTYTHAVVGTWLPRPDQPTFTLAGKTQALAYSGSQVLAYKAANTVAKQWPTSLANIRVVPVTCVEKQGGNG